MKSLYCFNMKISKVLVAVLALLVSLVNFGTGQNGEFEGSTQTGLGDDRLVEFTGDTKITFKVQSEISNTSNGTFTQKTADCELFNFPKFGFKFKGEVYVRGYVCANGLMRFKNHEYQTNPRRLGSYQGHDTDVCLAPYWSFVDLNSFETNQSKVVSKNYEDQDMDIRGVFSKAKEYGIKLLNQTDFTPFWVTVVTWVDLRPNNPGTYGGKNTFQLLLANGVNNEAVAVYLYQDIDWSAGVPRSEYVNYQQSSSLPVVGWNSGKPDSPTPLWNFPRSSTVDIEGIDDQIDAVLLKHGEIGIDLREEREIVVEPTPDERCQSWVNKETVSGIKGTCKLPCAPTLGAAEFNFRSRWTTIIRIVRFYQSSVHHCFLSPPSVRVSIHDRRDRDDADECCYDMGSTNRYLVHTAEPGSSRWHPNHPYRNKTKYDEEEAAYNNCCELGNLCSLFYSVREPCKSDGWDEVTARGWGPLYGDPHFVTLDGKNYTFNGCGWFIYFKGEIPGVNASSLVIQVRTTRVGDVNATGFTALAVKEGDSEVVQVNLKPTGGLLIRNNLKDLTPTSSATVLDNGFVLSFVNSTFYIITPLENELRVNEAANGTFLSFVAAFLPSYENSSLGLAGNWSGNTNDDFTLPNGTVLPNDMGDSDIFHNFGEAWRVPVDEIIYENIDDDNETFKCPENYSPIFLDEALRSINASLLKEAEEVCAGDQSCIFDVAATNNIAIGQSTFNEITTISNDIANARNRVPFFTRNISVIQVTLGETFELVLQAQDPDEDDITFNVPNLPAGASFSYTETTLYFSWNVMSTEKTNLTFLVEDTRNASSTLSPGIRLCRCLNGGQCYLEDASSQETAAIQSTFLVMLCRCPVGKTGEFCGEQKDFCAGGLTPPCHPLVTCTNHPTNFVCGSCPSGYEGNGQICSDTNECKKKEDECEQVCTNVVGSYTCGCNAGFTLDSDEKSCSDIDECSKANDCSQLCNNTIGSYECFCRIGFKINPNDTKSCTAQTECDPGNGCAHICYIDPLNPGLQKCECRLGYRLGTDEKSCEDIDECQSTQDNLCDQTCANSIGSYTCSCLDGYKATGATTCADVDECYENLYNCSATEDCVNNIGSYTCACAKRLNMIRVNGTCIFKEDESIKADLAPEPPSATAEQRENAIQITLFNFQKENYTIDTDAAFKDSVVKLVNDFCNANSLRPQDCGVSQNELFFNEKNVERLPKYPMNQNNDAILKFYVDYPSVVKGGTLSRAILASIISAELQKFKDLTGFNIQLDTPVTPPAPPNASQSQEDNAVRLHILDFSMAQWTSFYETVFLRAVSVTLNKYCEIDDYSRATDCGLSGTDSFNSTNVARLPGFPQNSGNNVLVSFYVNNPSTSNPVSQIALASMLVTRQSELELALSQKVTVQTSYSPTAPPAETSEQTANSVEIRISSFTKAKWTYLHDLRLRRSIADRLAFYCGSHRVECLITGSSVFTISDVQRPSSNTPSDVNGDNSIDYSFYAKYPGQSTLMMQYILSSVTFIQLQAMQSQSGLFFSLQTQLELPPAPTPSAEQSSNSVEIKILGQRASEWNAIQDNKLRAAIATQLTSYCTQNLIVCGVASDQASFESVHVVRVSTPPVQNGSDVIYKLFVNYPSGSGPVQQNLLAGILNDQIAAIQTATSLKLQVQTSTLAADPPSASPDQSTNAVVVAATGIQAHQWSSIQDKTFRGYIAQAIAEYCTASDAQRNECKLPGNNAAFTSSLVQRVPGSPTQNGTDAEIEFYVKYPDDSTMSQQLLLLIINEKLASIRTNTGFTLAVVTTIQVVTPPPPTIDNTANAISVILNDFQADEWTFRDALFRQNMAGAIKDFCNTSQYHREICNISDADLNNITAEHIRLIPNSPAQNGTNSILSFYAVLPVSGNTLPKSILQTIFTDRQDEILSVDSQPENPSDSLPTVATPDLTPAQNESKVPITIVNFLSNKFSSLTVIDIKLTLAARMNAFCSNTPDDICGLTSTTAKRKKRAIRGQQFDQDDVIVDTNSIMGVGSNTVLDVIVNQPGKSTPVPSNIVQGALEQTLQEDGQSAISSLTLATVNKPTVSTTQSNRAVSVRLSNTQANEWTLEQDISFRNNMSQAIVQFCNQSDLHLSLCNLTRDQLRDISFLNVRTLPNSPTQDGADAVVSFFVDLPGGVTMPSDVLQSIFIASPNVISQPTTINTTAVSQNPVLTTAERENLVQLTINPLPTQDVRLDVQVSIADKLNEYCRNNTGAQICSSNKMFTKDDVLVHINPATGSVSFVVRYPDTTSPVSASIVQDAISAGGPFKSKLFGLSFSVAPSPSSGEDEEDWPLILGLSIGGALLFIFFVLSIVACVVKSSKAATYKEYSVRKDPVYSGRGWQFERDSPYNASRFSSIDAIPGFDQDGLPADSR